MTPKHTEILFILDRSGSMQSMATAAIAGFNSFLREQAAEPDPARLTLVLFDDQYETPYLSLPLCEILPLDATRYIPRGSTALLDAIGRGIDELGQSLAALPAEQRPASVIVAILTDGEENASTHFKIQDIQKRIRHQTDKYQWNFLFLGANQDAIASAVQLGIHHGNAATYVADASGQDASLGTFSRKTRAIRKSATGQTLTPEELSDVSAPMQSILNEEDQKRRKP